MNQTETANLLNHRQKLTGKSKKHYTDKESKILIDKIKDNSIKSIDSVLTRGYLSGRERG